MTSWPGLLPLSFVFLIGAASPPTLCHQEFVPFLDWHPCHAELVSVREVLSRYLAAEGLPEQDLLVLNPECKYSHDYQPRSVVSLVVIDAGRLQEDSGDRDVSRSRVIRIDTVSLSVIAVEYDLSRLRLDVSTEEIGQPQIRLEGPVGAFYVPGS